MVTDKSRVQRSTRRTLLLKLCIGAAALAVFGVLFVRSLKQTAAEPYVLNDAIMTGWRLAIAPADARSVAILGLRPPLNSGRPLFDQIFQRTMQSLTALDPPLVPLVLLSEFNVALRRVFSDAELLQQAEKAGLNEGNFTPVCLGARREQRDGRPRELYYLLFDAPAFSNFRDELGRLFLERGGERGTFDPMALSPVMPVAASEADLESWLPFQANRTNDCQAPVKLSPPRN